MNRERIQLSAAEGGGSIWAYYEDVRPSDLRPGDKVIWKLTRNSPSEIYHIAPEGHDPIYNDRDPTVRRIIRMEPIND